VGQAIVSRLVGFGCARIVGVDPCPSADRVERLSLELALGQAHFVFVAAPLTAESHHLIDAAALAHARPGQFMVNVGRGSVVDEGAVADALDAGSLAGYAADVFACEDWALADRPAGIPARLLARPDTLFTPHLGSAVRGVRIAIEQRAADNIIAVLQGREPADAINRPAGASTEIARGSKA
jgi:phosphonate dehydrogenase